MIATPSPISTSSGSSQDVVVSVRITNRKSTAIIEIFLTSLTVELVASAVLTALPVMALSSPISL